jgi:CxxC-x17-CxxC domain-containing protein
MDIQDKNLTCRDCGREFVFTSGEQTFYKQKGFENEPSRCPDCRQNRKRERGSNFNSASEGGARGQKQLYSVTCADCGKETQVPFQPRLQRPVYCRDCFERQPSRT